MSIPSPPPRTAPITLEPPRLHSSRRAGDEPLFETCERRLVLSAQLLVDVLGDQALELHSEYSELSIVRPVDSLPLESHLREAHAATGWNNVQQQFGLTGKGQTVAIIDSGIAWDHVALGKGLGPGYRVVGGWDFTEENDANPYDDGPLGFHGTHVAGIIGSDSAQHSGVAPAVDLVALRVFNDAGQGQLAWVEKALQWVHQNRTVFENPITTVNLSLGTSWNADVIPSWATLEEELQALANDGIVVTASAGNSFQQYLRPGVSYPAASPYVLPVASVDDNGQLSNFSQRLGKILAAPGRNIVSTVPDHVLGRDGKFDDFSSASGTSMAAPYVAGASVLVRQAMEMVGYAGINLDSIAGHLHATADKVWDATAGITYDRLNLENAIDALIPDDHVGDTAAAAQPWDLGQGSLTGWLNSLDDQDIYRFTAATSGTLTLDAHSEWVDSLQWSLQTSAGTPLASGSHDPRQLSMTAGQSYNLIVSSQGEIGSFQFDLAFSPSHGSDGGGQQPPSAPPPSSLPTNLGQIDYYFEENTAAGQTLRVQAAQSGLFTVQWNNPDQASGTLSVHPGNGGRASDSSWSDGQLRVDINVTAGQWLDIQLPGTGSDQGELALANVLQRNGAEVIVRGGLANDQLTVDLQAGLELTFGKIDYAFATGSVRQLTIDTTGGNDTLSVVGSALADKVDLSAGHSTISNSQLEIDLVAIEEISYRGGGGPDRVYLYDTHGDDNLTAYPRNAELVGVGYRFAVSDIDRIFIHAMGGGQDFAYLYDSAGDDRLSVRPQFTSLSGDGFFNYVSGFERVYAYATAGGLDTADLYDSSGHDRFATSGASASIVGPGFSSFTRSFENVRAHAVAGGQDVATLYGSGSQTEWQQGSDFTRFREGGLNREARGFDTVETFVAGQPLALKTTAGSASSVVVAAQLPQSLATGESLAVPALETGAAVPPPESLGSSPSTYQFWHSTSHRDWQSVAAETTAQPIDSATAAEWSVLHESLELGDWLHERLDLPEEDLLLAPEQELQILDWLFSQSGSETNAAENYR